MNKKEQIIDTAVRLFATQGFDATGIQQLADEAGVAQGLLYRHFKNKQDLLRHIRETCLVQVLDTLAPYADEVLSFEDAFNEHIKRSCAYMRSHRDLWKVFHASRLQDAGAPEDAKRQIDQLVIQPIARKLGDAGQSNPEMHAWLIFTLIDGMMSLFLSHPEVYPLDQTEQFLKEKIANHDYR